jgi:hypothetical protein
MLYYEIAECFPLHIEYAQVPEIGDPPNPGIQRVGPLYIICVR